MSKTSYWDRSIHFDFRLLVEEVLCARAHADLLHEQEKISAEDLIKINDALEKISGEVPHLSVEVLLRYKDLWSLIEERLSLEIGDLVGSLRNSRARNDVAVNTLRMWTKAASQKNLQHLNLLVKKSCQIADERADDLIIGYSHLQPAQPITLGFLCAAYASGFLRDIRNFQNVVNLCNESTLGSGAMAGVHSWVDRWKLAKGVGQHSPMLNALDAISDRDFAQSFLHAALLSSLRAGRLAADLNLLTSTNSIASDSKFSFLQKELLELKVSSSTAIRSINAVSSVCNFLPLSYFRDLQEDKEAIFLAADMSQRCFALAVSILDYLENCDCLPIDNFWGSYILASDYADFLSNKLGINALEAHSIMAKCSKKAIEMGMTLQELGPELLRSIDSRLANLVWPKLTISESVSLRDSVGGTAPEQVRTSISILRRQLDRFYP